MHNRKLVIGCIALTNARENRYELSTMEEIRNELEEIIIKNNWFENVPFNWIGLILRFGLKNDDFPKYQRINEKYGDLPISIEIDSNEVVKANKKELKKILLIPTLCSLIHVAKKYKLPAEKYLELEKLLANNGHNGAQ